MAIAPSHLIDTFVAQLIDLQRVRLKWVPLSVFRHRYDNLGAISQLTHLAGTPGVHIALISRVRNVLPHKVIKVVSAVVLHNLLASRL